MQKKTICLNMIVKNESRVIRRCLASVKELIDTWVIVDTGSSDDTREIIKDYLREIPGQLYERPWVNFGHNRNEALQLAQGKADYLLLIDADDRLVFSEGFILPHLEADNYTITQKEAYQSTFREHQISFLIKNGEFEWEGVLHEFLKSKQQKPLKTKKMTGLFNEYINDGSRAKNPNKIAEDIATLEKAIREEPNNRRYVFYLARTYWSIRDYATSIPYFRKRAEMGGDPMEVYHSLLYIGLAQKMLNYSPEIFVDSLCKAYLYRPSRIESLYEIARYYAQSGQYFLGFILSKFILSVPLTKDTLFVESWVYDWGALLYFFLCAHHVGKKEEALNALEKLLQNPHLPSDIRKDFKLEEFIFSC